MRKQAGAPVPAVGDGKRGEAGHLGYLLRQAAAAYRLRLERALADLGVTHPQFVVLTMLNAYPGQSNADLARVAVLTPQTTSGIVANLLRAGLVARRPHAVHGRILQVELTEAGTALLRTCRARVARLEATLVDTLPPDEVAALRRWLTAVATGNAWAEGSR